MSGRSLPADRANITTVDTPRGSADLRTVEPPVDANLRSVPSLDELKLKWFIPIDGESLEGVPSHRGPGRDCSVLAVSSDGNLVTPLLDAKSCMRTWYDRLLTLRDEPEAELYHTGWRFEGVKTLGETAPESDALDALVEAALHGAQPYVLACGNLRCRRFNRAAVDSLRARGVRTARIDKRYPLRGSNHQKFTVFRSSHSACAILGSADIARTRWDSSDHLAIDPDRHPTLGEQTHELAVNIEGPAVADIEKTFHERWNDSGRSAWCPHPKSAITISSLPQSSKTSGTHSVQVLRTYGMTSDLIGYSWSPIGEFTVWASYLKAIKAASSFIYIEDQYFLPFSWPSGDRSYGPSLETDIIYQLGEAMKRGVTVLVTTSSKGMAFWYPYQKYQRDIGLNYLLSIRAAGSRGDVITASLECDGSDVYVHSKLMIVDDEFVSIGSANIALRSMSTDSELQIAIVDEENTLARDLRARIWAQHSGQSATDFTEPLLAIPRFKLGVAAHSGHLKPYPLDPLATHPRTPFAPPPPRGHRTLFRLAVDPYAGPKHLLR